MNITKLSQLVSKAIQSAPDYLTKKAFHTEGKKVLKQLAKEMGVTEYEVRSSMGGDGVLGEVTLHTPTLYVVITPEGPQPVMYRSCKGMKDYTGGMNHWGNLDVLENLEALKRVSGFQTKAAHTENSERAARDAEHAFELRAAFGPGEEVVNILTGQRYRT